MLSEATFLGFSIVRKKIRWTEKSHGKVKELVKLLTRRTRGVINYYAIGIPFAEIRALNQWLRRRMRLYYWTANLNCEAKPQDPPKVDKQWGRPRTRRRKLLKLGVSKTEVHKASRSRKGHWRMSQMSLVRQAMNNQWLAEQGLISLEQQWCSICSRSRLASFGAALRQANLLRSFVILTGRKDSIWRIGTAVLPWPRDGRWCGGRWLKPTAYPIIPSVLRSGSPNHRNLHRIQPPYV